MTFSAQQLDKLGARIDESRVHTRMKNRIELRYLEGHDVIETANDIFGYHAWSYKVTRLENTAGVWMATVQLTVTSPEGDLTVREDVGVGLPWASREQDVPSLDSQEMAIKGAVTDALKRALRTFGNAFGNSLYDKSEAVAPAVRDEQLPALAIAGNSETEQRSEANRCPSCDQPMVLRNGTTRDGRPYSAWFCSSKCGQQPIWLTSRKAS
jgi:DNA recombination protein Rad52